MKRIFAIMAALMLSTAVWATDVTIDVCEDTTGMTVVANGYAALTDSWTMTVETDSANKSEGTASFKIIQTNGSGTAVAAWWNNGYFSHYLPTPMNVSDMEYFCFDVKNDVGVAGLGLQIELWDVNNQAVRVLSSSALAVAQPTFTTYKLRLSEIQKDTWLTSGKSIDLRRVNKIVYKFSNGGTFPAGSFTYNMDNVHFEKDINQFNEVVLEDFEYADQASLKLAWDTTWAMSTCMIDYNVVAGEDGKCLQLNYNHLNKWTNYAVVKNLSTPLNLTGAAYMKVDVKGGDWLKGLDPTPTIFLVDINGRRLQGFMYGAASSTNDWVNFFLTFQGGASYGVATVKTLSPTAYNYNSLWRMDRWGAGSGQLLADLSQITAIIVAPSTQVGTIGVEYPINNANFYFDNIVVGYPMKTIVQSSTGSDKVYSVNSCGTAPTIDGNAATGEWDVASNVNNNGLVAHDNIATAAQEDVTFKAMYDANYLYIMLQAPQQYLGLDFTPASGDRDVSGTGFAGDDFEFFFAPAGNYSSSYYHVVLFPDITNNRVLIWDEIGTSGASSWSGSGDSAAITYANGTATIEYKMPFSMFNSYITGSYGTPVNGDVWGANVCFINKITDGGTTEYTNWEPDGTAGFAAGRPFGAFVFNDVPASVNDWFLMD